MAMSVVTMWLGEDGGRVRASVTASLPLTASGCQFAREDAEARAAE